MEYDFREIEKKWQSKWAAGHTFKAEENSSKPKYYVLDMFPYPSGAGLHVGHPLGYIASDIYSRYKRLCGFNVLHPMGYDAFGLPAEQYAIQTGQHPAVTTAKNIARYREQLDRIGFSFDWSREIRTCDPGYYKWTQWAFLKMFDSWYCNDDQKAHPISELVDILSKTGTAGLNAACSEELSFTAGEWNAMSDKEKSAALMNWRIAYQGETSVNWCPKLGTVLANDEVKEGYSVRGGYPVEQKIGEEDAIQSKYGAGSSCAECLGMGCQADACRTETGQQIGTEQPGGSDERLQIGSDVEQCIHVHQQMDDADVDEVAGQCPPPFSRQGEGTEVCAPLQ